MIFTEYDKKKENTSRKSVVYPNVEFDKKLRAHILSPFSNRVLSWLTVDRTQDGKNYRSNNGKWYQEPNWQQQQQQHKTQVDM